MCGGEGTRLDRGEKPMFEVGGTPMVDRVLSALEASRIDTVYAVTSPHVPETADHLAGRVPCIESGGEGYVEDLSTALDEVDRPVLTAVADLPLISGSLVDETVEAYDDGSLTVCVSTVLKTALGVSADTTRHHGGYEVAPTGLNVVGRGGDGGDETLQVSYDARLAVNVNHPEDATVAEVLCDGP